MSIQPITSNNQLRAILSWLEQAREAVRTVYHKRWTIPKGQVPVIEQQQDMARLLGLLTSKPALHQISIQRAWQLDAYLRAFAHWLADEREFLSHAQVGVPDASLADMMLMKLLLTFEFPDVVALRQSLRKRHG